MPHPSQNTSAQSFKQAEKAFRRREYQACHRLLLPLLEQIGTEIPLTDATTLLFTTSSHSARDISASRNGSGTWFAVTTLCAGTRSNPLKIYYVAFNIPDLDYQATFRNLTAGKLQDTATPGAAAAKA